MSHLFFSFLFFFFQNLFDFFLEVLESRFRDSTQSRLSHTLLAFLTLSVTSLTTLTVFLLFSTLTLSDESDDSDCIFIVFNNWHLRQHT